MSESEQLLKPIEVKNTPRSSKQSLAIGAVYILLVILGIGTGYLLTTKGEEVTRASLVSSDEIKPTQDATKTTDPSCPVGMLESGGIGTEGTHKLIRQGGPSQTAYLTSSVLDLDEYVGKNVRVCGATLAAKKAGWLMDVESIDIQE